MPAPLPEVNSKVASRCASLQRAGSMDPADPEVGTGAAGEAGKGDFVRIQLRVRSGRIGEARFKVFGCSGSIACASLASEWAEGRTLEEALAIRGRDLSAALDLPAQRRRCSTLAESALRLAVRDFWEKQGLAGEFEINRYLRRH
jgi:NifU-like protein involved in Fe-S cluster formation